MNDTFEFYKEFSYYQNDYYGLTYVIPYKFKKVDGNCHIDISALIQGEYGNSFIGYRIIDSYFNITYDDFNEIGFGYGKIDPWFLYEYDVIVSNRPTDTNNYVQYEQVYQPNCLPIYTFNMPITSSFYNGNFLTDSGVFGDYQYMQYINQQQEYINGVESSYEILYTYTPRTCRVETLCSSNPSDWNKLFFVNTPNIPTILHSSYKIVADHIWPDVEYNIKVPLHNYYEDYIVNSYVSNVQEVTSNINFNIELLENDPDKYLLIYYTNQTSEAFGKIEANGTITYSNEPVTITNTPAIPYKFLENKYNTSGIMTGTTNGIYKKIIPLPNLSNNNYTVKSQVSITPTTNISQGTTINFAISSIQKYTGTPVNNHDYKPDFGFISEDTFDIVSVIDNYTDDNIFQVVGYYVYSEYPELKLNGNDVSKYPEYFNPYEKEPNYEQSIVYQSNSCIENIFDIKFNIAIDYNIFDTEYNILAMRCYYNEPSYISYTIPQDISSNESYTFSIDIPVTITDGIVYHVDTPFECNFEITPEFYNDFHYENIITNVDLPINISPIYTGNLTNFTVTEGSLPDGLTLDSVTGIISGAAKVKNNYNVTIKATDNKVYYTTSVNITVKAKQYNVYLQDNIIIYEV